MHQISVGEFFIENLLDDSITNLKMLFSHMSQIPKNAPVSVLNSLQHTHTHTHTHTNNHRQMFVSPNKEHTHTHTHTQQPGEVCVCHRARQQLSVLLQQSTFIKPNKQKHLVCDVPLQCTNQTTQPNRDRERSSTASGLSVFLSLCSSVCLSAQEQRV